jgi:hypothetical protein
MMYPGFQMDWSWMGVMSLIWTALAVLGVVALVWLIVVISRVEQGGSRVLDDLLARGLISTDEYQRRRALVKGR